MFFRQLFDAESSTYTYLLADNASGEAVIIDPVKSRVNQYLKLLDELSFQLIWTLDTHIHADHVTGSGLLKKETGCLMGLGFSDLVNYADIGFKEGAEIFFGEHALRVISTPGHTPESISFYTEPYLFTGDILMIRATGRTDFQQGSAVEAFKSLQKLLALPDETYVYPAHDYNGMTRSSIKEEKRFNPRLQVQDDKAYEKLMAELHLPKPKLIDFAVPLNQQGGLTQDEL